MEQKIITPSPQHKDGSLHLPSSPPIEEVGKLMAELFYAQVTKRADIRELLARLTKK